MANFLAVIAGPDKGQVYPLSEEFNILLGRSRHTVTRLTDPTVSRVHCEIEVKGKRILITDQESVSGTFVNGKRIAEGELRLGDVIKIGDTQIRVEGPTVTDVHSARTILAPSVQPPPRPVLLAAARLHELTGVKLNHYEVGPVVAKGHSGLVFKASDFKNDREVAFKVMWPEFTQNEEDVQRFIRAMKTMLPLRHPNLISLYGAGKTGPYCWIAMEFVEGESLAEVIARLGTGGVLDWKNALRITIYLARALEFAHSRSIVHRNITPQNVLVGKTPDVTKLGDLMLAKAMEGSMSQQITKPGQMLGDVHFISPEQTGASPVIDGRSDIFSLGALLYQLLTGRYVFDGPNLVDIVTKIRSAKPTDPKKFQPNIPDPLQAVVLKMLAKKPEDRYPSATELIKNLESIAKLGGVSL